MKESSTYQAILAEGREEGVDQGRQEEATRLINIVGGKRFGEPGAEVVAQLKALPLSRLEELAGRLMEVETWGELLA